MKLLTSQDCHASLTKFNCKSSILNSSFLILNFSKSAFSLIELSIILIIIGLLIAGVTGGASLIQSAKVRSMINEIKDYEKAVYTFQAAKERYPGDVKNYGTFGVYSNYDGGSSSAKPYYTYQASDFPDEFITEFQKTAGTNVVPDYCSAPFVELYNEGIIDFRPLGNTQTGDKRNTQKGTPNFKNLPEVHLYFNNMESDKLVYKSNPPCKQNTKCLCFNGLIHSSKINKTMKLGSYPNNFNPKFLKAVDEKIDDGYFNTGLARGFCDYGSTTYEESIKNNKKCIAFYYAL